MSKNSQGARPEIGRKGQSAGDDEPSPGATCALGAFHCVDACGPIPHIEHPALRALSWDDLTGADQAAHAITDTDHHRIFVVEAGADSNEERFLVALFQRVAAQFNAQCGKGDGHFCTIPPIAEDVDHLQHVEAVFQTRRRRGHGIALETIPGHDGVAVRGVEGPADLGTPQCGGGGDVGCEQAIILSVEQGAQHEKAEENGRAWSR